MSDKDTPSDGSKEKFKIIVSTKDLIRNMKKHKVIWDRTSTEYRDRLLKEQAWLDIFRELQPGYDSLSRDIKDRIREQVVKKWNNVRDSYVKSRKNARNYLYSDILSFLDRIYFDMENQDTGEINSEFGSESFDNEIYLDVEEPDYTQNPLKRVKLEPRKDDDIENDDDNESEGVVATLAKIIEKEEDEDRAFFKSITSAVKSLSSDAKFEFRIEVMNLIRKLKAKDESSKKNCRVSGSETD